MTEQWRPIVGFEDLYEVSDQGRVRRIGGAARNGKGRGGGAVIGRVLKPLVHRDGYRFVQLWSGGRPANRLVHILVAQAFLQGSADLVVNHKDGCKTNNAVSNLEWVTSSENNAHAYRTGLRQVTVGQRWRSRNTHCPQGHEFTPENTRWKHGSRVCRTCHRTSERKRKTATRRNTHVTGAIA